MTEMSAADKLIETTALQQSENCAKKEKKINGADAQIKIVCAMSVSGLKLINGYINAKPYLND